MRGLVTMIDPAIIPEPIQERFSQSVLHQKLDRGKRREFLKARALAKGRQAIFGLLTEEGGCEEVEDVAAQQEKARREVVPPQAVDVGSPHVEDAEDAPLALGRRREVLVVQRRRSVRNVHVAPLEVAS